MGARGPLVRGNPCSASCTRPTDARRLVRGGDRSAPVLHSSSASKQKWLLSASGGPATANSGDRLILASDLPGEPRWQPVAPGRENLAAPGSPPSDAARWQTLLVRAAAGPEVASALTTKVHRLAEVDAACGGRESWGVGRTRATRYKRLHRRSSAGWSSRHLACPLKAVVLAAPAN
jgi:hypothetical protein